VKSDDTDTCLKSRAGYAPEERKGIRKAPLFFRYLDILKYSSSNRSIKTAHSDRTGLVNTISEDAWKVTEVASTIISPQPLPMSMVEFRSVRVAV
jgi:hypothetical protein